MTLSLLITLLIVFLITVIILWNTITYRNKITTMSGMMIAMVLGMSVGLTIGLILGILFSGNLYHSTLLAIIIGIITGFLAGVPISILAVLDGIMAGIMGGMMGAMLGVMVVPEFQDSLIRITFLLFIAINIILIHFMQQEIIKRKSILRQPFVMITMYVIFIFGYIQMKPLIDPSNLLNNNNHNHMTNNSLIIKANEFLFNPNKIEISSGEKVTITLMNTGKVEHDLEVIGLKANILNTQNHHTHQENNNKVHVHSLPGETKEISFVPLLPGEYQYTCTIPGHAEEGMTGIIKVS